MVQNKIIQILFIPFSLIYGLIIGIRNFFYETGILRASSFNIPVINVGNISIGGTGKTPHIEYLIRLLNPHLFVATLSRGYKRKSRGFKIVSPQNRVSETGDEPLVFKRKYQDITAAVSESREVGIPQILQNDPRIQLILLDDAFQHRSVIPGLNILLTDYSNPFTQDYLLPSGRLREWRSAYKRADVIVVTKCPNILPESEKTQWEKELNPLPHQRLFFSYYKYFPPYYIFNPNNRIVLSRIKKVLLLAAIAQTDYLMEGLSKQIGEIESIFYEDHHYFTKHDLSQLKIAYELHEGIKPIILTTEKDAVRLAEHRDFLIKNQLPVFVLPIDIRYHFNEGPIFDQYIKDYLLNFRI